MYCAVGEKKLQKWKQDDRERKIEEWEGCGPPVKTLVRRTACEEAAAYQLDDCYCLPEHLMAEQCHSLYASRAHLTSFISMSRFYKTKQLIKDKSILLLLNMRNEFQLCICCLIFNWYFRLGLLLFFCCCLTDVFSVLLSVCASVHMSDGVRKKRPL